MSWRDPKWKYRTAEQTKQPGYLARRMRAYARLQRMRKKAPIVATITRKTGT